MAELPSDEPLLRPPALRAPLNRPDQPFAADLARKADAILKRAGRDSVTGAKMDRQYRRNKSAEQKRLGRYWRARRKQLGTFGPASPVRTIKF
jgi:hypothetical protein